MDCRRYEAEWVVALRRELHRHAEPAFGEHWTQARVRRALTELGLPTQEIVACAGTGLWVDVRGRAPASSATDAVIVCRAELDGLPGVESDSPLPHRSTTAHSHLCGHDGHMAALIGAAALLLEQRDSLPANCVARLLFQPAEETGGGAVAMVAEGALRGAREAWAMHNHPADPLGLCVARAGSITAGCETLRVELRGQGGHSSFKAQLRDPVAPLCRLNYLLDRHVETAFPPFEAGGVSFCAPQLCGSPASNVIPDTASATGKLRYRSPRVWRECRAAIEKETETVAREHCLTGRVESLSHTPPVVNDAELVESLKEAVGTVSEEGLPLLISEDFGHFAATVPSCYVIYRTGSAAAQVHQKGYDFNDEALDGMARLWVAILYRRWGLPPPSN